MSSALDPARANDESVEAILANIDALAVLAREKRRLGELQLGRLPDGPSRRSLEEILAETAAVRGEADRLELELREQS